MQIIRTIEALRSLVSENRKSGKTVGFVPTMGYLHSGHLTLVDRAKTENSCIVVSIFVNPLQFGANEDLAKYPRNLDRDAALLEQAGVDILFAPSVEEMYPRPIQTIVDVPSLGGQLEGEARPGHFAGVATVVSKLFNIVVPDHAYFGEKDFQQLVIIRRMVEDLAMPVCVHGVPTVREADGLACSSRNSYLSPHERAAAIIVPQALEEADRLYRSGMDDPDAIEAALHSFIASEPLASAEVVAVRDPISLERHATLHGQPVLLALFVRIGSTCLLDNRILRREANSNVKAS